MGGEVGHEGRPLGERLYGLLLRMCPPTFRRDHGPEVRALVRRRAAEVSGRVSRVRFWLREYGALLRAAMAMRGPRAPRPPRPGPRRLRRARLLEGWTGDVRLAARGLLGHPGFAASAVLVLALGIGLDTAIFSVFKGTLLAPFPYPDAERLRVLGSTLEEQGWGFASLSIPEIAELTEGVGAFEAVAAFRPGTAVTLTGDGAAEQIRATFVEASYLRMLGATAARGRTFGPEVDRGVDAHPEVVVSHRFWRDRLGGDPAAVGSVVRLSDRPFAVVGVLEAGFRDLDWDPQGPDLWIPLGMGAPWFGETMRESRLARQYFAIARLRVGVGPEGTARELRGLAARLEEAFPVAQRGRGFTARDLRAHFFGGIRSPVIVLFLGAGLVLLICVANVAGLLLVRGETRTREMAVRRALGAGRWRVARQVLVEGLMLALLAGVLGVGVAAWATGAILEAFRLELPAVSGVALDVGVLAASLVTVAGIGLLFGAYPAVRAARIPGVRALSHRGGSGGGSGRVGPGRWGTLVAAEVAVAVVIAVGAGLTAKSLHRLAGTEVGYDPVALLTLRTDLSGTVAAEERRAFADALLREARAMPGVEAAALWGPSMLGNAHWHVGVAPPGADVSDPERRVLAQRLLVSPGALEMLGIRPLVGRTLTAADLDASGDLPVVVDRRLAEAFWPDADPLGRTFPVAISAMGPRDGLVVGVVGEVQNRGRIAGQSSVVGDVYLPYALLPSTELSLLLRVRGDGAGVVDGVRGAVARLHPGVPVHDVAFMTERLRRAEATPRFTATLMALYAAAALLLALIGTYGVLAYTVRRRTAEIAIRSALGAGRGRIQRMVLLQAGLPVALGLAVGIAGALAGGRVLASLLFQVSARDPQVLAGVAGAVLLAALLASWLPARRAASLEPMRALREE